MKRWLFSRRRNTIHEHAIGNFLILIAFLLAVWTIWLSIIIPDRTQWSTSYDGINNYTFTWVSLDCIEVAGLAACGILFRKASPSARTIALLTIPIFFIDAWFDVFTSTTESDLISAILMAALAELPAIIILSWIAWKALGFRLSSKH